MSMFGKNGSKLVGTKEDDEKQTMVDELRQQFEAGKSSHAIIDSNNESEEDISDEVKDNIKVKTSEYSEEKDKVESEVTEEQEVQHVNDFHDDVDEQQSEEVVSINEGSHSIPIHSESEYKEEQQSEQKHDVEHERQSHYKTYDKKSFEDIKVERTHTHEPISIEDYKSENQYTLASLNEAEQATFYVDAAFVDWFLNDISEYDDTLENRKLFAINRLTQTFLIERANKKIQESNKNVEDGKQEALGVVDRGGFLTVYKDYINTNLQFLIDAIRFYDGKNGESVDGSNWTLINENDYLRQLIIFSSRGPEYVQKKYPDYQDAIDRMINKITDDDIHVGYSK